jgi:hypothetical protein
VTDGSGSRADVDAPHNLDPWRTEGNGSPTGVAVSRHLADGEPVAVPAHLIARRRGRPRSLRPTENPLRYLRT